MPVMLAICQRSFDVTWSAASFEAEFLKEHTEIYVYVKDKQLVAYLIIWAMQSEGEVVSLAVNKGFRNQGIASELLAYIFRIHGNIREWYLEVATDNILAINLYEKYKFHKMRVIKNYYGQNKDALQMKCQNI
jgi:ribosomal-protein-alanine N-acetyltransferase